jgi:hypothetical protein
MRTLKTRKYEYPIILKSIVQGKLIYHFRGHKKMYDITFGGQDMLMSKRGLKSLIEHY